MSNIETSKNNIKMSLNKTNLSKWIENGNIIPSCINEGCENFVAIRHWSAQFDPSLKTECSRCANARKKSKKVDGIIFHKKKYCENRDGILGFLFHSSFQNHNGFFYFCVWCKFHSV